MRQMITQSYIEIDTFDASQFWGPMLSLDTVRIRLEFMVACALTDMQVELHIAN